MRKLTLIIGLVGFLFAPNVYADWYYVGNLNNFDATNKDYQFTPTGSAFSVTIPCLKRGEKFKITDGVGWNENSFGGSSEGEIVSFEKDYTIAQGNSTRSISIPFTIYNATIYLHEKTSSKAPYIYITGTPAVYMIGDWGQTPTWSDLDGAVELEPVSEDLRTWYGKFYGTRSGDSYNYFRFSIGNSQYGPESTSSHRDVVLDSDETAFKDSKDKTFRLNESDYYFVTVTRNEGNTSFRVSKYPSVLYLYGDLNGDDWKQNDYYSATAENGIYKFTDVRVRGVRDDINVNYIAFFSSLGAPSNESPDFSAMLPRFGGDESQQSSPNNTNILVEPVKGEDVFRLLAKYNANALQSSQEHNFQLPEGIYDITVDLNGGTVAFNRKRSSISSTYSIVEEIVPWSKDGVRFTGIVTLNPDASDIDLSNIAVVFEPGDDGDWNTGSGQPENMEAAEWEQWQRIEASGQLVDGYWDSSKVKAVLAEEPDGNYSIDAIIPCSGKYKVSLASDEYDLSSETPDLPVFLTVYPSLKNLWILEDYKTENGDYIPLCLNINGITMNVNDSNDDFDGWFIDYPFIKMDEGDDQGVIWNFGNLHNSKIFTPGVYFTEMWVSTKTTEAEPETARYNSSRRRSEANLEGYQQSDTVNLSEMSDVDGTGIGSKYEVNIVLRKNGAMTPMIGGSSEETFIVSPNTSAPLPTRVDLIEDESTAEPVYYNLHGIRVTSPSKGIYLKITGNKVEKVLFS